VLDSRVVGQANIKEAVLLGLLAREHVYIEGPPGVAKTYMAELISEYTGLSYWFYQLHRDTRLNEIIGEAVITKETTPTGDIIRQDVIRGGILKCEIAILDDISRAPGEALNVLLRILNERKFGSGSDSADRIPLLSAIATGNPASDDAYFAEALDPATLDRFALQVRPKGLINEGQWESVAEVIDMYAGPSPASSAHFPEGHGREIITKCSDLVPEVEFGESTKNVFMELLRVLHEEHELGETNSLLTDRTFLIKAVKIIKAHAVLNGRQTCEPADLKAMRFMTTFRVPAKVHDQIEDIIAKIIAEPEPVIADCATTPAGTDFMAGAATSRASDAKNTTAPLRQRVDEEDEEDEEGGWHNHVC
jgi:MoxR-like ATPase